MAAPPSLRVAVVVASSRVGKATICAILQALQGQPPPGTDVAVRAVLRDAGKRDPEWDHRFIEVVSGLDTGDAESLRSAFREVQRAFIIAPQAENRADIVNTLLAAAKEQGVTHVVLIGGVFQEEEKFTFHRQWMSTRRKAEELGLFWTQLECSDFMENLLGSFRDIREGGRLLGVFPKGVSSPVALEDVGRAAAAVLLDNSPRHRNRAYRIVGPQALGPLQVAEILQRELGRPVEFTDLGLEESMKRSLASGRAQWQVAGFAEWQRLYFSTGRLNEVRSDLPLLDVTPTTLSNWAAKRKHCLME